MAIFSVSLPSGSEACMRVDETPYENAHRAVVMVEARKFLNLWRVDPYKEHQEIAEGTPATWRQDYKCKHAVKGFSYGFTNPVPLPEIGYAEEDIRSVTSTFLRFGRKEHTRHVRFVSFLDGLTRTIWLLSHGCNALPVECPMSSAPNLHRAAGVAGTQVFTVREVQEGLIPVNHKPPYH